MKKIIFILGLTVLMSGTIFIGCLSSDEKVEAARNNLNDANKDVQIANQELTQAKQDSILMFRQEAAERISLNKKSIADLKLKISKENKVLKAKNEKKLEELEKRNNLLEKSLADYKDDEKTKWSEFKIEFNNDLDELGKAFQNLTK
ncbi:MAG: hypothetical protein WCS10_07395 [Bacteroidales bacterium]|jgi:hypothetical protein|nr:hypothetical protein [Bacteroidales bacterium]MDD4001834.1 hypothetical protein [Bacteroidales bacterium]MDD4529442.1 hypothetical protein [Bacteroidales bacterium]MDD4828913.1 hypothetical protein [Bacteroidales bacterium]